MKNNSHCWAKNPTCLVDIINVRCILHHGIKCMNKDWLAQNPDNVSGWRDISTRGLLFKTKCLP
jgi:hypothetical protein